MKQQSPFRNPWFLSFVSGGLILLLAAAILLHVGQAVQILCKLLHALRPLLLGLLFAEMLTPTYTKLKDEFTLFAMHHGHSPKAAWITPLALTGAMLPPLVILGCSICILLPQLLQSAQLFADNLSLYRETLSDLLKDYPATALAGWIPVQRIMTWLNQLQEQLPALLRTTYDYTTAALHFLLDIGIGAVFSLYLLADKPRLKAQAETLLQNLLSRSQTRRLMHRIRITCRLFARFLNSQCKEALIIGILCWCGMSCLHFPYPVLISVITGVTNIVPYFGAIVGTLLSVLLLLLVKPAAIPAFLLFIVILQQIESNLIYPRIVGHSIGLPPAWVLAAITCGGSLFGFTGMLLAVPVVAAIFAAVFGDSETDVPPS